MQLKPGEADLLAIWFESDTYKIFRKHFLEAERERLAQSALAANSMEELHFIRGRADALKQLHLKVKEVHKQQQK